MNESIEFQLYDWLEGHTVVENEDSDAEGEELPGQFIIHSFGRCMDGRSVYSKIINYTPYFYFLIPKGLQNKPKEYVDMAMGRLATFLKGKDNKKVFYKFKSTLKEVQAIRLKIAEGFTNDKEYYFARLIFTNAEGMKKYKSFLENNMISVPSIPEFSNPIKVKLYEANLPPMLRCFHIREISGCAWVETSKYELIEGDDKESWCDVEIVVDWRNLNPIKKDNNAPFRICSFDIECNSIDGEFPQARREGDAVIQIGCTYTYLGQSKPYRQFIACLGETAAVDDTVVVSCETEQELMMCFLKEITSYDCDIITGYNTFFFDEKYMYDRCKNILGMEVEMSYMSKLKSHRCKFEEKKLASSALGENLLRYWDTPGRVHIDLMKDIQKTFNLPSYKLDYVASKFIRGDVVSYMFLGNDMFELTCKSVSDINIGDYIHLEVIKGFVSDEVGEKYLVRDINMTDKKIIVKGDDFLASELDTAKLGGTICWSQAKDDVGPKDIFRLQKGSADDRAVVAKYCVKDCKLVNLLINKLEVVTKNIEMANVCYVPLCYLFLRGQGIKLFSLCLREFRKQKYAFPVLKLDKLYRCLKCNGEYLNKWECPSCGSKNREEVESESSSYEGAIVFDPVPKVDYEALATKDYMSLYPASIMHKNMSHETIVEDPTYDNLPGIKYYNANFKESDGSIQYRRFAQIENRLGVIPSILDNLLKTRKMIKKQMGKESDPFKYKILDAKQLAVKITANSLYGQLGASTSPVCKRDIAACTTSTGREMLVLAKRYDEEFLPHIMNGLKYFYKHDMMDKVERMYDLELKAREDTKLIEEIKTFVTKDIANLTFQPVIRYGDSVIGSTPLLLRNSVTGEIFIESIDRLANKWQLMERELNDQFKESCELVDIESWTEKGWTKVQRVIRHKLAKEKKLFRVTTYSGSVVVTDDHSLLSLDGKEVSSKTLKIGDMLLHSFPNFHTRRYHMKGDVYVFQNDIDAMKQYLKGTQEGINYMVNYSDGMYVLTPDYNVDYSINKIEEVDSADVEYVYDLTTTNHHFHAGVGSMIVHNTDSIFSCYRFRENTALVSRPTALKIWKNIIAFGRVLIEPFFGPNERAIFNEVFTTYYSDDKVVDLMLPEPPVTMPEPTHHAIILPIEERIRMFVREYMQESYIPWLWTLAELVEKDYTYMFDIKLIQWAEHQLHKIRLVAENLTEQRRNYIMIPVMKHIDTIFNSSYIMPSDDTIKQFTKKLLPGPDSFPIASEIKIEESILLKSVKTLMEKTIKEKWVYSTESKELNKTIIQYLEKVTNSIPSDPYMVRDYLIKFISDNVSIGPEKMTELLNNSLLGNKDMGIEFKKEELDKHTKEFIEQYIKNGGKKSMDQIIEEFLTKEIGIDFDLLKKQHYMKVIEFIKTCMRRQDMSTMDDDRYLYYWLQPRWDFDENGKKLYMMDIYEGGMAITDKRTLEYGMKMGELSGETIKSRLPFPHDCEYEKTFWPFAILTKKRYVGNKYEYDPNKYKQDFMGIVLKRRDNAPIVKEICGGIIDYLINKRDPDGAKQYTRKCLMDMFEGKYDIKYFLQSRTLKLKSSYKDWKKIAHVYLAEKIAQRDPGNTPQSGDRIEFAVIKVPVPTDGSKLLQGDMIEIPQFIKQQNLSIDYMFYLTNQIMNPALQFLELVDKNAMNIFKEFIDMYSAPKVKKERVVKEKPPKPIKEKVVKTVKTKPIKEPKPIKEKVIKEKVIKTVKTKDALDLLMEIKSGTIPKPTKKRNLELEIKQLIDTITESIESNKPEESIDEIFL
jgi:DNA polymerase elongation subunit (family B)